MSQMKEYIKKLDFDELISQINSFMLNESSRIQHVEDLIFWDGSDGAIKSLESMKSLTDKDIEKLTIKWD